MTTISVVQYNVLAEGLSNPAMSPDAGFTSMPPDQMRWSHRGELVLGKLLRADADVVCLQEVDHYYDSVEPAMRSAGYGGLYREDASSPCRANTNGELRDGVALFYKRRKLELLGSHVPCAPRSNPHPADFEIADAGKCLMARFRVLDVDAGVTSGTHRGERARSAEQFIVCTAHLAAAQNEEGASRLFRQMKTAVAELLRFRDFSFGIVPGERRGDARFVPIVFAGDLNATPKEDAVRYLRGDLSNTTGFAGVSAYEKKLGAHPEFTTWKIRTGAFKPGEARSCIDHIFVSEGVEVVDILSLPTEEEIGKKALPCEAHPSDHLMLRATIRLPSRG